MTGHQPPYEWVPGKSRAAWLVGFLLLFCGVLVAADLLLRAGLLWAGVVVQSPNLTLVVQLAAIFIAVGPGVVWTLWVPMPASGFWLTPRGLIFGYGVPSQLFTWDRVAVRGTRLETLSRRLGIRAIYSVTPYQAERIAVLRRVA